MKKEITKQQEAILHLGKLWADYHTDCLDSAEDAVGKQDSDEEAYGDGYRGTGLYITNPDECLEKAKEIMETDFDIFKNDYQNEIAEVLMPEFDNLLDDDMPDAVSKFIEDLSFKTLKEKIENN